MGIFCEISLFKPADGVFRPLSIVSGAIKYAVDEDITFTRIAISLKGKGKLHIRKKRGNNSDSHYYRKEEYANTSKVLMDDENGFVVPTGSYETQFSFELPQDIPPSFAYNKNLASNEVKCKIIYYIRIKFERSGFMTRNKFFKKDIEVVTNKKIVPTLPTGPCVLGERNTLTQLFSSKKSIVNLKATIENSIIKPGGKINIKYELTNDTNVTIRRVKTKLFEIYKFYIKDNSVKLKTTEAVKDTCSKTDPIKGGEIQNLAVEIAVSSDITDSLEHTKLLTREYCVIMDVALPMPHRNVVLPIPVQIGDVTDDVVPDDRVPPPSYWEAMHEEEETEIEKEKL